MDLSRKLIQCNPFADAFGENRLNVFGEAAVGLQGVLAAAAIRRSRCRAAGRGNRRKQTHRRFLNGQRIGIGLRQKAGQYELPNERGRPAGGNIAGKWAEKWVRGLTAQRVFGERLREDLRGERENDARIAPVDGMADPIRFIAMEKDDLVGIRDGPFAPLMDDEQPSTRNHHVIGMRNFLRPAAAIELVAVHLSDGKQWAAEEPLSS